MKSTMYGVKCPKCGHEFDYTVETYPLGYFDKEIKKLKEMKK